MSERHTKLGPNQLGPNQLGPNQLGPNQLGPKRVARIPGYTDERQTAEELGLCLRTLRKWRARGEGPPYVKIGKKVHYPDDPRTAWLKSRVVQPVRERAPRQSNEENTAA
jgi:hypothetical protein